VKRILVFLWIAAALTPAIRTGEKIHVPVWPDPKQGGAASLKAGDLTAKLEGEPARIRTVLGPEDELLLLLVMDVVGDLSLVEPAKRTVVSAIQDLPENVYVGLMQAQDGLTVLVDPTPDREKISRSLETLPVSGRPGLLDTVETVSKIGDEVLAKSEVRVAVLYITDSDVREYREDFTNPVINRSDPHDLSRRFPEGLIREKISKLDSILASLETPVFVVHLDYRSERLNEAYQAGLIQLSSTTGGTSLFCRSSAEIPSVIQKMLQTVKSFYRVDIELPPRPPKILQVQLESADGPLSYRQRFLLDRR